MTFSKKQIFELSVLKQYVEWGILWNFQGNENTSLGWILY